MAEPVIYREELLPSIRVLGDIRHELRDIHRLLEDDGEEEEEAHT